MSYMHHNTFVAELHSRPYTTSYRGLHLARHPSTQFNQLRLSRPLLSLWTLQSTFKSGSWLGSVHLTISQMFEMLSWWCSLCFIWSNCYSFFLAAIKMTADSSREETIIVLESRFYYSCHDFIVQSIVAICSKSPIIKPPSHRRSTAALNSPSWQHRWTS